MDLKTLTPERQVSESGLRYYSATWGRWCSRDPAGWNGGINLYQFVSNLPLLRVDPFGLASCPGGGPHYWNYDRPLSELECFMALPSWDKAWEDWVDRPHAKRVRRNVRQINVC